jgi:hypothetical protein
MEHLQEVIAGLKGDRYGASQIYELWEKRYHEAIRNEIAKPGYSREERNFILAETDPFAIEEIDHLADWSCEKCSSSVTEQALAQSLNMTGRGLCSSCLTKELF